MKRLLLFLLLPGLALAQNWAGILAPARAIDWSGAGVVGGVPNVTTVCSTLNPGATVAQIQSAINACVSGVVVLNAGTYSLAGGLVMKTGVVVRGAGADLTRLNFTANGASACNIPGNEDVCFGGSSNWSGGNDHSTTWTAGYAQGATSITLGSTAGLSVGQILILDQQDDTADTGNYFVNGGSTAFSTEAGSPGRFIGGVLAAQQEYKLVTAISGSTVTISPGLYSPNWRSAKNPGAWWANTTIRNAGLEDLTLDHSVSGTGSTSFVLSGTAFVNAYNCWYKGVRSIYAIGSGNGGRDHILLQTSNHITIRDSYFYGTRNNGNLSYGVETYMTGDDLVENNIFQFIDAPLLVGNSEGSVFGYNFGVNMYNNNATFNFPGPPFTHDAGTALNLFEGNQGTGGLEDDIHGTHNMHTYFRNQYFARDDAAKVTQIQAIEVSSYARYMAYVGNVLGQGGVSNKYQVIAPDTVNCNTAIFSFGFQSSGCVNSLDAALVSSTAMRWGNYDVVNNAVRFVASEVPSGLSLFPVAVPASQTLPASFYRSAVKPVWWGTMPYPAVGPDVTGGTVTAGTSNLGGHAYMNPARNCAINVMGIPVNGSGAVVSFNANTCYPTGGSPTPAVSLSAATLAFGSQQIATTSANQTSTLSNTGTGNLIISAIALGGTNASDFSQTNTCGPSLPFTLTAGGTCVFTANFHPAATGAKTGQISVTDNATGSPHVIALTGTGVNLVPAATFSPTSLSFAARNTGTTSAAQTATLTNSGTGTLTISGIGLAGANSGDFAQVNNCGVSLAAGASCTFTSVTFSPTAINGRSASIQVTDNAVGSPHLLALSGTGLNPAITFSPTALAFGNQIVNTQSSGNVLTITSSGTTALQLSDISITGANANQFSQTNSCSTLSDDFSTGALDSTKWVIDTGAAPGTIAGVNSGTFAAANVSLAGGSLQLKVTQAGAAPVTSVGAEVRSINRLGYGSYQWRSRLASTSTTSGGAGSAVTGQVSGLFNYFQDAGLTAPNFTENDFEVEGQFPSQLEMTSWTSSSPSVNTSTNLTQAGMATALHNYRFIWQPGQIDYYFDGTLASSHTTNVPSNPAYVINNLWGTNSASFGGTATVGTNRFLYLARFQFFPPLNAGQSCTTTVRFLPTSTGAKTASLSFTDSANSSPHTVALTGTGLALTPNDSFSPTSLTFGSTAVGASSATQTITLTNNGTGTLNITSILASGDFSRTTTCGATLAASATCNIVVTFTPTAAGTRSGAITVTDNAAGSPHVLALTGTGTAATAPIVSLSASTLTFPNQTTGTTSGSQGVILSNTGTATLTVTFAISGDYSQTNNCAGSVAAAASCTINVSFSPTATGTRTGTLTLTDNASGSPHTVSLTGTGVAPTFPVLSLTPASLTFPATVVGNTSASQTATLQNIGTAVLNITSITVTGTNSGDFVRTNNCGLTLAVGASCTVGVVFTPTAPNARSASLTVTDDASGSPHSIPLSGSGLAAIGTLTLTPASIAFPNTLVGVASAPLTATLSSTGTVSVTISSISTGASDFSQTNTCGGTLAPGANCLITLTFTPSAVGARTGTLTVTSSAAGSPNTSALTGSGIAPGASISPASIAFGNQTATTSSANQTVTFTNNGTALTHFTSVTLTGTDPTQFTLTNSGASACTGTLNIGATCQVLIAFAPTTAGSKTANISFADDAPASPQTVSLTGTGIATQPAVTLAPTSLTFGSQQVSTSSATQTVVLTNSGLATLTITSIVATGDFSRTTTCGGTLAASAACNIVVTFTPTISGARSGAITITDSAAGSPHVVPLSGTGTPAPAPSVSLSLSSLTYTAQQVGTSSAAQVVTLTNNGTATLNISGYSFTGANGTDFTQTHTCGATVAAAASCTISITFTPLAAGTRVGVLNIADDAAGNPHTVSLTGTAFNGVPGAVVSPNVLTFPRTKRLVASAPLTVTLTNNGTASLLISGISISGDFSQSNTCGSSLAQAATCTVSVVFTPTATGTRTGTLTLTDNASGSPHTVALSGTGSGSKVKLSATAVAFPDTIAGQTSPDPAVVLTNEGDATLVISSVTVSTVQFTLANGCPTVLAPLGSCNLTATFTPSSAGAKTANLVITDDAPDSPQSVALSGTGLAAFPLVTLTPTSLDFGSIQSGSTTVAKSLQIKNTGTAVLNVSSITKTGTNAADYALTNTCGASFALAINATCSLSLTFTPSATGTRVGQINIADDASDTPQVAPLTGLGTAAPAPAVTLTASSLSYSSQQTGTISASQTVTMSNSGDAVLNISSTTLVGSNAADFAYTTTCAATLGVSGVCQFVISFAPLTAGSKTATLQISDDASDTPQAVTLAGTAFAGTPGASLSVSSLSYPNQIIFTSSLIQSLTLTNNGTATLSITAVGVTGDFAQSNTCGSLPTTLATGNSCTFTAIFTPTVTGARTGTLSITDNAPSSPQTVSLTGTGDPTPPPPSDATALALGGHAAIGGHAVFGVQLAPPSSGYVSCILPDTLQTPAAPNFGGRLGMNTVIADPEPGNGSTCFHNPIARLSDANFDPSLPNLTLTAGCDGSGDEVTMNADSTLLTVCNTGARTYPMTFNASTLQVARMYVSANAATGGMFIGQRGFWSRTNPLLYYTVLGTQLKGVCFGTTVTSGNCNGPIDLANTPTAGNGRIYTVFNFASAGNCLAAGFTPIWTGIGRESALDQVFTVAYSSTGPQNTGVKVAVYSVGLGCTVLDTSTGQIISDWGVTGAISISDRFTLHAIDMSKSGAYIILSVGNCLTSCTNGSSPYAWQLGTNSVFPLAPAGQHPSGHFSEGYDHWINNPGSPLQYSFYSRPFSNVTGWVLLDPSIPNTVIPVLDSHPSWNNADVSDSRPVLNSSWTSKTSYPGPYYNEIDGLALSGGTIYRFAHSFIAANNQRFATQYGIGQVSQDGKFFLFSSDMLGTLGAESGASTCTVGTNCRGDVFLVKLQ